MTQTIRTLKLLSLSAIAALGCASTSTVATPEQAQNATQAPQSVAIQPASAPSLDPVYFDMDRAVLRTDARASLKARADAIKQHPEWGIITIQGHCDERGSDEYNLALGDRRASAVKNYLLDLGVPASRLTTVTFGENRPAVAGHDENAWRFNRRSELAKGTSQSASR
jgi:peptidoglycan-associated lipoprotein